MQFDSLVAPKDVLVVGDPEQVAEKLVSHRESPGGIDRFTFQMDNAGLTRAQLLRSIKLIGRKGIPLTNAIPGT